MQLRGASTHIRRHGRQKGSEMARKTGIPTLLELSKKQCKYIVQFTPIITLLFSDNAALLAALQAANETCAVLIIELSKVREYGD